MGGVSTDRWRDTSLGAEVELLAGFPFQSASFTDDPTHPRLLRGDNVAQGVLRWDSAKRWPLAEQNGVAAYELNRNDVIVAMDRPWIEAGLKYAWVRDEDLPCLLVQRVSRLRCKEGMDQIFLRYVIGSRDFTDHVLAVQTGTSIPHISAKQILQFGFRCPPLAEQRAIARVLGALDDKIELNRRLNRSLEELAQAVFRSWFVDFDPVTAKASGRPPIGLDHGTAALFPDHFQDSELGEIPKGWRVGRLDEVAEITMGTSPSGDTYNDVGNGTPLINGPVEYGDFFPVKIKWTTEPTRFCQNDDLIFCVRGSTTGRRVVADGVYCLGRGVCSIHGRDGNQGFVDLAIEQGMDSLLSRATGSTFPSLNGPEIKGLALVIPPDEILKRFAAAVDPLREQVRSNIRQQHTLAAARDALLPPLLSGELRVPDAERFVEQLA